MDPKNPRFTVSFQILSMIEHVLFELFRRINLCNCYKCLHKFCNRSWECFV